MLVLTLKTGHSIKIGEDITIHGLTMKGNQMALGFEAPKEIAIVRDNCVKTERVNPIRRNKSDDYKHW